MMERKLDVVKLREVAFNVHGEMQRLGVDHLTLRINLTDEEIKVLYEFYGIQANRGPLGHIRFDRYLEVWGLK